MGTQCLTLAQMMGSFLAWLVAPGILREVQPAQCSSHSVPECQMSSLQTISSWRPKASANSGDGSSHLCHVRERKALGSIAFGPDVGSVYCRKKTKGDLLAYSLHFSCACCRFWLIKQPPLLLLSASLPLTQATLLVCSSCTPGSLFSQTSGVAAPSPALSLCSNVIFSGGLPASVRVLREKQNHKDIYIFRDLLQGIGLCDCGGWRGESKIRRAAWPTGNSWKNLMPKSIVVFLLPQFCS